MYVDRCAAADKLDAASACADMGCLLFRTDEMYMDFRTGEMCVNRALDGLPEASAVAVGDSCADMHTPCANAEAEQSWSARLPEAYATMVADDKLEAMMARTDERSVAAEKVHAALDAQYEATFAKADMRALQHHKEAPGIFVIDDLDKASVEGAFDRNLLLKHQKTTDDWACPVSQCSTAVPSMDLLPELDEF